jgi:hypothetical protein
VTTIQADGGQQDVRISRAVERRTKWMLFLFYLALHQDISVSKIRNHFRAKELFAEWSELITE